MTVIVKVCIEDAQGGVSLKREVEITPGSKPEEVYTKLLQPFAMLADQVASVYVRVNKSQDYPHWAFEQGKVGLDQQLKDGIITLERYEHLVNELNDAALRFQLDQSSQP
jgi:hypothetical protein